MGLDDFKTSSSTTTTDTSSTSTSTIEVESKEPEETGPWFTAIIKKEDEIVRTFYDSKAFYSDSRHKDERFLNCIETEEEFDRLDSRCQELYGCGLEDLFHNAPLNASDFVDRLDSQKPEDQAVECEICGETILVTEDKYTKVDGHIVHADHRVDTVAEELELSA